MGFEYDLITVGAGPAGMLASGLVANAGKKVMLVEKNKTVGKKLSITGKGRCNITNNCSNEEFLDSVATNKRFLYSAINNFSTKDTIKFFNKIGVKTKVERGKRVFPSSDKASQVVDSLFNFVKNSGCEILNDNVKDIIIYNKFKKVIFKSGNYVICKNILLACGGMSYPKTGSDGYGYKLAQKLGHSIITPKPSLVPLVSKDNFCKHLQGLSLRNVEIKLLKNGKTKPIFTGFGEMLFTHFGLSGPLILSASSHIKNFESDKYQIIIDLKPSLSYEKLDKRLQKIFYENINKDFQNSLGSLLPKKLIPVIIDISKIPPSYKCNNITKSQRKNLAKLLKEFKVNIFSFRPIEEAIITCGGINTKEINPKTMQSKIVDGLFFAGEIIDVDAYTGGFNLQIAFSTAYTAYLNIIKNEGD